MDGKRVTRPELDRTEPLRSWSSLFEPASEQANSPSGAATGEVDRDVSAGYRVIEEYMRQGFAAATQATQDGSGVPRPAEAARMLERMFRSAGDLGTVWLDMMQSLWTATQPNARVPKDPGPFDFGPATPVNVREVDGSPNLCQVSLRVRSRRELEVSLHVHGRQAGPCVVHELRSADADAPRLAGVGFAWDPETPNRAIVTLSVADEHPAGTYSGLVVSTLDNLPRATISVRIDD